MVVPSEPADKADRSDKTYPNPRRDDSVVDTIHGTKVRGGLAKPDSEFCARFFFFYTCSSGCPPM